MSEIVSDKWKKTENIKFTVFYQDGDPVFICDWFGNISCLEEIEKELLSYGESDYEFYTRGNGLYLIQAVYEAADNDDGYWLLSFLEFSEFQETIDE